MTSVRGLIAELPDDVDPSDVDVKRAEQAFFGRLTKLGCISDAKPMTRKVPLTPRTEQCRTAAGAAEEFWKPRTAEFAALDREWQRTGVPMERQIRRIQERIRLLRKAGSSQAKIDRLVQTRRTVRRMLNRFEKGLQI